MMPRSLTPVTAALVLPLSLLACLRVGPGTNDAGTTMGELSVSDFSGEAADPEQLPLRPRLAVHTQAALTPDADTLLLFAGAPDSELIADLAQAPLREDHRARLVASELDFAAGEVTLSPRITLASHELYTLAVPGWARARGTPLKHTEMPLVYRLRTTAGPDAGARVIASWPAQGATNVGTHLEAAVIAFDGRVEGAEQGVWLEGPDGLAIPAKVASAPCASIAPEHAASFCARIVPDSPLAPSAAYALVVGTDTLDAHRAPVGPWRAVFYTAAGSDRDAPALLTFNCAVDEQAVDSFCVLLDDASVAVRLQTDEAAIATLRAGGAHIFAVAPHGEASLRLQGLAEDVPVALELSVRDSSGNEQTHQLALRTLPALATLAITEVRADALGPEPQQELVELLNYGTEPVDLRGFALANRADTNGVPITRSFSVAPHTRVLLVADSYDPSDRRDATPPPGTPLVRVGRALTGAGLSNAGAPLFLRDPQGHRVSAAPANPPPRPGVCLVRTSADMRDGSTSSFDYDAHGTCTPGT